NERGRVEPFTRTVGRPHGTEAHPSAGPGGQQGESDHSSRNATMGSTRDARSAGTALQAQPTPISIVMTASKTGQSRELTPTNSFDTRSPLASTAGSPSRQPNATSQSASRTTLQRTLCRGAPSAMRRPNSDVRRATVYDSRPKSPKPANATASAPNPEVNDTITRSPPIPSHMPPPAPELKRPLSPP